MIKDILVELLEDNGLIVGFVFVAALLLIATQLEKLFKYRFDKSAIAILMALIIAGIAGKYTGGSKGLADISIFSGLTLLGGSMLRDFTIVSTVYGVNIEEIKKCGLIGIVSLLIGILLSFIMGVIVAYCTGYTSAVDLTTIAAGCVTFVVGPVTGSALGASSTVIALSIAAGLVKSIVTMAVTPLVAKYIGLTTPRAAMVFGGLLGTTSGVSAALAATDKDLVPYGAMTATFCTGLGCLLCPSILYSLVNLIF